MSYNNEPRPGDTISDIERKGGKVTNAGEIIRRDGSTVGDLRVDAGQATPAPKK